MASIAQAVRMALHYGEEHLGVTDVFGEDVGPPLGGVFTATQGLKTAWNTPLDERGIVGTAMGIAYAGGRPVCEIQFCDYALNVMDMFKVAGNQRWASGGEYDMPIVVMTPTGAGIRGSIYHSHSFESWASRLAGWKVVCPSNALDAYGLMIAAIKDPNPVFVLLPKALLRAKDTRLIPGEPADAEELSRMIDAPVGDRVKWKPQWPDLKEYVVPLGKGELVREGGDGTVISWGRLLPICVQAADELARDHGHGFDVIDLRSIFPYDWDLISRSVQKTGRVLVVNEDTEVTNFGEHLIRRVVDEHFYDLAVRPRTLMGKHIPGIGMNQNYEKNSVPQLGDVRAALRELATDPA
jgi:2-oxoisovalerate dehydrogenase E1 component beta subunit